MASVTGGDKFKVELGKISEKLNGAASVQVGFLPDATYPDDKSVAMIAAIQEFGAPRKGIPPRPFFRAMIRKESPHWGEDIKALLKDEDFSAKKTLGQMGSMVSAELQQSIIDTNSPALSPVTIMLRSMKNKYTGLPFYDKFRIAVARVKAGKSAGGASTKPLVDTGHMLDSVDFVVKAKYE